MNNLPPKELKKAPPGWEPPEPPNTCTGSCCSNFPLPLSLEMIKRRYQNSQESNGTLLETKMLAEMLIPIQNESFTYGDNRYFWFTCKNFNVETKKCMIYDKRPSLCRTYPDDKKLCSSMLHNGCDMKCGTPVDKARDDFRKANGLPTWQEELKSKPIKRTKRHPKFWEKNVMSRVKARIKEND